MEIRKDYLKVLREIDSLAIENGLEIWKSVEAYDNYNISNMGRVMNTKTGRILKCGANSNGYSIVKLCNASKKKTNRLVANAFIPNLKSKQCIDHIDNNRLNNNVSNLRWVRILKIAKKDQIILVASKEFIAISNVINGVYKYKSMEKVNF